MESTEGTPTNGLGQLVLRNGAAVELPRGATLFNEGDPSTSVFACRTGRLKMTVTTPSGAELLLGWKEPGEAFGELSAIDGRPRSARATASVDCVLATMSRRELLAALERAPGVAVSLLVELSDHLRRSNRRVAARHSEQIPVRVGNRLIELAAQVRRHGHVTHDIELTLSQDDLAGWVGATRESTARALGRLRRAGLVTTARGRIVVRDLAALESAVADRAG